MNDHQNSSAATEHEPQHNHRVYFACECCADYDPENGVFCRSDIAVMPDGTWLCDNCYVECDKTAYGIVCCDVDDFQFPRFEDLPRPAPYPVQQVIPDDAQSAQVRNATIEECARITTAPFGLAYTSQRHKEVAKDVADQIGRAIRALAAQPPAAPVDTDWFDECAKQAGKAFRYWLALEKAEERFRGLDYLDFANEIRAAMADPPEPMPVPSSSAESAAWDQPALDLVNQIWDIPADWHPARRKAHAQVLIIEALKARRTSTEPQAAPVTQNAAALAERLIQAAVDYEDGRCSKREMAEARTAVESAIRPKAMGIRKQRDELLQLADWLDSYARLKTYSDGSPYPVQKDFSKGAAVIRQAAYTLSRPVLLRDQEAGK